MRKELKVVILVICFLIIGFTFEKIVELNTELDNISNENAYLNAQINAIAIENNRLRIDNHELQLKASESEFMYFEATAYCLSIHSCEKPVEHEWYGISANGFDMRGLSRDEAMSIAVDPNVIPLGSKLEIIFLQEGYEHFSGIYTANDVGGAIKGALIDVFMGDFDRGNELGMTPEVRDFGRQVVKIRRIK